MTDQFVDYAKSQMGAVEKLLKGLPGINGYINKELRRDADKRVREGIAQAMTQSKNELLRLQTDLLGSGGLQYMDDLDGVIVKLQTLTDRIRTASYGYAGLFDAVRIKEPELDALNRFDVALAQQVGGINTAIAALSDAIADNNNVLPTIKRVGKTVADMSALFDKRSEAIVSPDLLAQPGYAPAAPAAAPSAPPAAPAAPPATLPPTTLPGDAAADIKNDPNAVG